LYGDTKGLLKIGGFEQIGRSENISNHKLGWELKARIWRCLFRRFLLLACDWQDFKGSIV